MTSEATFEAIYAHYAPEVHRAAYGVLRDATLAEDIVQEVFERVWRGSGFDQRRGPLGPYLRLLARSRALDLWRSAQAGGRATDRLKIASGRDEPRTEDEPVARFERDEHSRTVRAALGALPAPQREAVVLAYWGGLTADQIARRAGVPLGTEKSRIRLGLAKLRSEIEDAVAPVATAA